MDKTYFERSLKDLKLDQGWFSEIPRDLLYLAFSPRVPLNKELTELFNYKFGAVSYQTLEFYGDRVLSLITSMMVFQLNGLMGTPGELQLLYQQLTSNEALTNITIGENFCQDISRGTTCNYSAPTSRHNICSDSLEAIFGAIFIYGISHGKTNVIKDIFNWFISFKSVSSILEKYNQTGSEAFYDLLDIDISPIRWELKINTGPNSKLWRDCPKSRKPKAKAIWTTKSMENNGHLNSDVDSSIEDLTLSEF